MSESSSSSITDYEREAKQIHAGTSIGWLCISRIRMHESLSPFLRKQFFFSLSTPIKATGCGPKVVLVAMIMFKSVSPLVEWNHSFLANISFFFFCIFNFGIKIFLDKNQSKILPRIVLKI